jgi:polysaccharide export outer membrane protein
MARVLMVLLAGLLVAPLGAQQPTPVPPGYIIGPDDVLTIVFWREKDLSAEAVVRPDGKISLPLLNDVEASGLTPDELRERILTEATRYIEDPAVTVVVKEIRSRKVFITGQVEKPGAYLLTAPTTVMQLISMAGGLREFADSGKIVIIRVVKGAPTTLKFHYGWVLEGKNPRQNIELRPGDTVAVP